MSEQSPCPRGIGTPGPAHALTNPALCVCCGNFFNLIAGDNPHLCRTCQMCPHLNIEPQLVCEDCGHREAIVEQTWTNFREQRPSDGETYEFLWVEHYGTKRREIGTFSDVDGWIWVGGNGINPREKKAVFYRELVESPTPAEIEAAVKGVSK